MGKKLEEDEGVEGGFFLFVFQMRVMTTRLYTDRKIQ